MRKIKLNNVLRYHHLLIIYLIKHFAYQSSSLDISLFAITYHFKCSITNISNMKIIELNKCLELKFYISLISTEKSIIF